MCPICHKNDRDTNYVANLHLFNRLSKTTRLPTLETAKFGNEKPPNSVMKNRQIR